MSMVNFLKFWTFFFFCSQIKSWFSVLEFTKCLSRVGNWGDRLIWFCPVYLGLFGKEQFEERGGSVVECLAKDWGVVGLSLTGDTALCLWGRHFIFCLVLNCIKHDRWIHQQKRVNLFKPDGISHSYQLGQSIFILRDVGWYFSFLLNI